jgi:tetratricopeptide (TPR) repeat protein
MQLGKLDAAKAMLTRSVDVYTKAAGPKAKGLETTWQNLAELHRQLGDDQAALDAMQRALDLVRENRGPDDPGLGWIHNSMGTHLFLLARMDEAQPHLQEALRIFEAAHGESSPSSVFTLSTLMQNYLRKGEPMGAAPYIARGLALLEHDEVDPAGAGLLRYSIAMTMWDAGVDRPRALALAHQAVADMKRSEQNVEEQLASINGWIAEIEPLLAR